MSQGSRNPTRNQRNTFRRGVRCVRLVTLILALSLSSPQTGRSSATITAGDMAAMMRAMLVMAKMWNSMFGDGSWNLASSMMGGSSLMDGFGSYGMPAGSWASMMGITDPMAFWGGGNGFTPPAMTPWPGAFPAMPGTMGPYGGPRYGGRGITLRALQGAWAGANGALLMIDGNRFMLYLDEELAGIGTLRITRQSLLVQDAVSRQSRTYRLTLRGNLMIWAERGGRTKSFRRIAR